MAEIFTLTLNPAIDRTVFIDSFTSGELNRGRSSVTMAGGKGINVSRMLRVLGDDPTTLTFTGGKYGDMFRAFLSDEGMEITSVTTEAETRLNVKIIEDSGRCTELNGAGGPVTDIEMRKMLDMIDELSEAAASAAKCGKNKSSCTGLSTYDENRSQVWIISGSIPHGVDKNVYKCIVDMLVSRGAYVALDCSGAVLERGLLACPTLIKPNIDELGMLVGRSLGSVDEVIEASTEIFHRNVDKHVNIICTMGRDGAVYVSDEGIYTVDSPHVEVRGFAGAGDTFLAAFVHSRLVGSNVEKSLCFASAAAGAKVALAGTAVPDTDTIEAIAAERKAVRIG